MTSEVTALRARLMRRTVIDPETGCYTWTGALDRWGYGKIKHQGRTASVHRVAYTTLVRPLDRTIVLDHLCRNRACWAIAHMEPVSARTNLERGMGASALNARKTHCPQGHLYDEANTYWRGNRRNCRACRGIKRNYAA